MVPQSSTATYRIECDHAGVWVDLDHRDMGTER